VGVHVKIRDGLVATATYPREAVVAERRYSCNDTILYALSVGVGANDPVDSGELKYVYEPCLEALPTFAATLAGSSRDYVDDHGGVCKAIVLHTGQSLRMSGVLPPQGVVRIRTETWEVRNVRALAGTLLRVLHQLSAVDSGATIAHSEAQLLLRTAPIQSHAPARLERRTGSPHNPAEPIISLPTARNQALMYRLTGDRNPLHVDPGSARAAGFTVPVLHGLALYGMVGRALIKAFCNDCPARMLELRVSFTNVVFPGEPLCLHINRAAAGKVTFRVIASERELVVLELGVFKYRE
jgi:acyl dehydratase